MEQWGQDLTWWRLTAYPVLYRCVTIEDRGEQTICLQETSSEMGNAPEV